MQWDRYTRKQVREVVDKAISQNLNYRNQIILGLPGSFLDPEEFYEDAPFLQDSPFLKTLVANPNHIGCHTLGDGEPAFQGTAEIERDLLEICACEIFRAKPDEFDGYVASGGTEANLQAMWIYRNYFQQKHAAKLDEIAVLYSEDTHYCVPKGLNMFQLNGHIMPVDEETRKIDLDHLRKSLEQLKAAEVKYLITYMNLGTTMFGSVDPVNEIGDLFTEMEFEFFMHGDGAFGGFIYPFSNPDSEFHFENPYLNSFTLDAHKMLQAPFGTGIFLIRKGFMEYALTEEAGYVKGLDYTMIGSRSGANAVAVWMILRNYGSEGWTYKIRKLVDRTSRLCDSLDERGISYYRDPFMNIVTIHASDIPAHLAEKFLLVPERHDGQNKWWKIVVMEHVTQGALDLFLNELPAMKIQNS
ncbi:pyridoxal-dependent decarboxylase [Pontibacter sp. G13]|uniref:pyridoxal phosphate-dependent decarboxylase family protein n=1 Tax=Pontibacter sp. G13 TaxID=3074898 RepID=UPI00288958C6|nr:pyridoxal-dependent decarboxylase [Pontibacter sp. G13]WNJ18868.1 pyridoxal-dependent decarboxylase [Pontibacter sp. G13]